MAARIREPLDLHRAIKGHSSALAGKDAVHQLTRSGVEGARERLSQLVRDDSTLAVRRRAALGLSLLDDARVALLDMVDVGEPSVIAAVLLSLARVGRVEDLDTIRAAGSRVSGTFADQARFAELVLAHRLGLGVDVVAPVATPVEYVLPVTTRAVAPGTAQDASIAWSRFVPNAHLGFEPDGRRVAIVHCARRDILVIPSNELTGPFGERLLARRMLAGATASYDREAGLWRHDLWIFSTPTPDGVELQAWTTGGQPSYAGPGRVTSEELVFSLRTTASTGLALADITGRLTIDLLSVEGTVGDRPPSSLRVPAPLRPPQ